MLMSRGLPSEAVFIEAADDIMMYPGLSQVHPFMVVSDRKKD